MLPVSKKTNEYHHWTLHIRTSLSTKNLAKRNNFDFSWKVKSEKWKVKSEKWKVSKYGVISGPYLPVFGLNTEIYSVNLGIQSKYRKMWTSNNSGFGQFTCSDTQKSYFLPKMEKVNSTIEFRILELVSVPSFSLSWKFAQKGDFHL